MNNCTALMLLMLFVCLWYTTAAAASKGHCVAVRVDGLPHLDFNYFSRDGLNNETRVECIAQYISRHQVVRTVQQLLNRRSASIASVAESSLRKEDN